MNETDTIAVAAILLCTLLNFYFSLAGTALETISRSRLGLRAARHNPAGYDPAGGFENEQVRWLLSKPTRIGAAVQIGTTVCSLTSASVGVALLAPGVAHWLYTHSVPHDHRVAVVLIVVIIALITLVIGEMVPRAIGVRYADRVARSIAGSLLWVERIERPLVALVLSLSNLLVRPFGMSASFQTPGITEEELRGLLESSEEEGVIHEDEKEMLSEARARLANTRCGNQAIICTLPLVECMDEPVI